MLIKHIATTVDTKTTEQIKCNNCPKLLSKLDILIVDGKNYCYDCYKKLKD